MLPPPGHVGLEGTGLPTSLLQSPSSCGPIAVPSPAPPEGPWAGSRAGNFFTISYLYKYWDF